jgi:hypothetical protein
VFDTSNQNGGGVTYIAHFHPCAMDQKMTGATNTIIIIVSGL